MRLILPRRALVPVALTLAVALAPSARADSFAYRDGDDAVIVNADGSRSELVIDGSPDEAATAPVVDPAGNLTAIMTMGKFTTPALRWVSADGSEVVENLLPEVGPHGLNAGPLSTAIDPTGKLFAYTYLEYTGTTSSYRPHLAIVDPKAPGSPTAPAIDRVGYSAVNWFGNRLLASDTNGLYAERASGERLVFDVWPLADGLGTVDLSADGSRGVVGAGSIQFVVALSPGGPPASEVTAFCVLPDDGSDLYRGAAPSAAISEDGTRVAYSGRSGLHIARIGGLSADGGDCALQDVTLVSAKGGLPTSSAYTIAAPTPPGGGTTPPGGGTTPPGGTTTPPPTTNPGGTTPPGSTTKPGTSAKKKPTLSKPVRRGRKVTVTVKCPTSCKYKLKLMRGKRTLSTRTGRAKAGRAVKVTLGGAKGKGLSLRLTVGKTTVTKRVG